MSSQQGYWYTLPAYVIKSRRFTGDEKDLYLFLYDDINGNLGGYSTLTNAELAKEFDVSVTTISQRLASMVKKKLITMTPNHKTHQRRIYPCAPGEPSEEAKPTEEEMDERTKNFQTALKKSIVFGTIDFNVLIEKLLESPYLENVKDNSTQFILDEEQIKFLADFKKCFPRKEIDCQVAAYPKINYRLLVERIQESEFLNTNTNLTLKWCLENSADILAGKYNSYLKVLKPEKQFKEHDYSPAEYNAIFQSIDEIVV